MTQASGLSASASAKLSAELAKLAADASSFFNVPMDVALEKIRGLVGESEPIRSFGVLLSEAAVGEEALRIGLVKSTKELNDQTKVLARASLITKGMAKASGDLERHRGHAANQMKKFVGSVENFKADFGKGLIGPLTEAIKLAGDLGKALNGVVGKDQAGGMGEELKAWIAAVRTEFFDRGKDAGLSDQDYADKLAGVKKGPIVPNKAADDAAMARRAGGRRSRARAKLSDAERSREDLTKQSWDQHVRQQQSGKSPQEFWEGEEAGRRGKEGTEALKQAWKALPEVGKGLAEKFLGTVRGAGGMLSGSRVEQLAGRTTLQNNLPSGGRPRPAGLQLGRAVADAAVKHSEKNTSLEKSQTMSGEDFQRMARTRCSTAGKSFRKSSLRRARTRSRRSGK